MKRLLPVIFGLMSGMLAQAQSTQTIICETPANDAFADVLIDMPEDRDIWSGSKIIVSYDKDVPQEMIGAFDYAVRLWEEVLPTTLPVTIKVGFSPTMVGKPEISAVELKKLNGYSLNYTDCSLPFSAIKAISLKDYNVNGECVLIDPRDLAVVSNSTDIVIGYNPELIKDFSFNLDAVVEADKYDFVTIALRDIALGLGFINQIDGSNVTKKISYPPAGELTPYDKKLKEILGTDESEAYQKAVGGSISLMGNKLYTPDPFVAGQSLQYFVADESATVGRLLDYNFSKGYVMRDLTYPVKMNDVTVSNGWDDFFTEYFEWVNDFSGGSNSGSEITVDLPESNILPFKGEFTFDFSGNAPDDDASTENQGFSIRNIKNETEGDGHDDNDSDLIDPFPYSLRNPVINESQGTYCVISAQLNDGTWDNLTTPLWGGKPYTSLSDQTTLTVDMESLIHSYLIDNYARTVSGGLKYRVVKRSGSEADNQDFQVQYFTRSYTPQSAMIKYSKLYEGVDGPGGGDE